jgi:hypothetical protein
MDRVEAEGFGRKLGGCITTDNRINFGCGVKAPLFVIVSMSEWSATLPWRLQKVTRPAIRIGPLGEVSSRGCRTESSGNSYSIFAAMKAPRNANTGGAGPNPEVYSQTD